jgi:hypothetical protein
MAIRGSRISLPLAVGVDCNHPQWLNLSPFFFFLGRSSERRKWPLGVARSISFFFLVVRRRDENDHWGWPDLSLFFFLVVRQRDENDHQEWPDLSLFLF